MIPPYLQVLTLTKFKTLVKPSLINLSYSIHSNSHNDQINLLIYIETYLKRKVKA